MSVSEVTALKIENLQLKLSQLELTHQQWTKDLNALIAQARQEAGAEESARYNVQTRSFDAAPAELVPKDKQRVAKRA